VEIAIVITLTIVETALIDRTLPDPRASATSARRKTADRGNIQKKSVINLVTNTRNDLITTRDITVILKTDFVNTLSLAKVSTTKVFKLLKPSSLTLQI
jgi:hypothetical protein